MWPKGKEMKRSPGTRKSPEGLGRRPRALSEEGRRERERSESEGGEHHGGRASKLSRKEHTHTTGQPNVPMGERRKVHPLELNYWTSLELQGPMYIP